MRRRRLALVVLFAVAVAGVDQQPRWEAGLAEQGQGGLHAGGVVVRAIEAAAQAILLPSDLPLVGGNRLSAVLPGGAGNDCTPAGDDRDVGPDGTTRGWYFYLNFEAAQAPYTE